MSRYSIIINDDIISRSVFEDDYGKGYPYYGCLMFSDGRIKKVPVSADGFSHIKEVEGTIVAVCAQQYKALNPPMVLTLDRTAKIKWFDKDDKS